MQTRRKPTILVVEDEVLVRMMLADALGEAGFKVIEAANADEALSVLAALPEVDAVVIDVQRPGAAMNGSALARRVRALTPDLRVLVAAGRGAPAPGEVPDGCHLLAEPIHPAALVRVVSSLLAG